MDRSLEQVVERCSDTKARGAMEWPMAPDLHEPAPERRALQKSLILYEHLHKLLVLYR